MTDQLILLVSKLNDSKYVEQTISKFDQTFFQSTFKNGAIIIEMIYKICYFTKNPTFIVNSLIYTINNYGDIISQNKQNKTVINNITQIFIIALKEIRNNHINDEVLEQFQLNTLLQSRYLPEFIKYSIEFNQQYLFYNILFLLSDETCLLLLIKINKFNISFNTYFLQDKLFQQQNIEFECLKKGTCEIIILTLMQRLNTFIKKFNNITDTQINSIQEPNIKLKLDHFKTKILDDSIDENSVVFSEIDNQSTQTSNTQCGDNSIVFCSNQEKIQVESNYLSDEIRCQNELNAIINLLSIFFSCYDRLLRHEIKQKVSQVIDTQGNQRVSVFYDQCNNNQLHQVKCNEQLEKSDKLEDDQNMNKEQKYNHLEFKHNNIPFQKICAQYKNNLAMQISIKINQQITMNKQSIDGNENSCNQMHTNISTIIINNLKQINQHYKYIYDHEILEIEEVQQCNEIRNDRQLNYHLNIQKINTHSFIQDINQVEVKLDILQQFITQQFTMLLKKYNKQEYYEYKLDELIDDSNLIFSFSIINNTLILINSTQISTNLSQLKLTQNLTFIGNVTNSISNNNQQANLTQFKKLLIDTIYELTKNTFERQQPLKEEKVQQMIQKTLMYTSLIKSNQIHTNDTMQIDEHQLQFKESNINALRDQFINSLGIFFGKDFNISNIRPFIQNELFPHKKLKQDDIQEYIEDLIPLRKSIFDQKLVLNNNYILIGSLAYFILLHVDMFDISEIFKNNDFEYVMFSLIKTLKKEKLIKTENKFNTQKLNKIMNNFITKYRNQAITISFSTDQEDYIKNFLQFKQNQVEVLSSYQTRIALPDIYYKKNLTHEIIGTEWQMLFCQLIIKPHNYNNKFISKYFITATEQAVFFFQPILSIILQSKRSEFDQILEPICHAFVQHRELLRNECILQTFSSSLESISESFYVKMFIFTFISQFNNTQDLCLLLSTNRIQWENQNYHRIGLNKDTISNQYNTYVIDVNREIKLTKYQYEKFIDYKIRLHKQVKDYQIILINNLINLTQEQIIFNINLVTDYMWQKRYFKEFLDDNNKNLNKVDFNENKQDLDEVQNLFDDQPIEKIHVSNMPPLPDKKQHSTNEFGGSLFHLSKPNVANDSGTFKLGNNSQSFQIKPSSRQLNAIQQSVSHNKINIEIEPQQLNIQYLKLEKQHLKLFSEHCRNIYNQLGGIYLDNHNIDFYQKQFKKNLKQIVNICIYNQQFIKEFKQLDSSSLILDKFCVMMLNPGFEAEEYGYELMPFYAYQLNQQRESFEYHGTGCCNYFIDRYLCALYVFGEIQIEDKEGEIQQKYQQYSNLQLIHNSITQKANTQNNILLK